MRLYNTLTRSVESFEPLDPKSRAVTLYVCGPTVYDDPHLGHARSAYVFDVLRRYLGFCGFAVQFVRNVTDVDDKIIEKAKQELGAGGGGAAKPAFHGTPSPAMILPARSQGAGDIAGKCQEVSQRYLESYHRMLERLGIRPPDREPRATEHVVPQMTDLIAKLLFQGIAYEAGGDVYFSVRKFEAYGKLSNRSPDELLSGARVEPGEHKQDPLDFALWKAAKPGEPSWQSPWGFGRPGWHIECSAMSTHYLGDGFDIHGGGVDLVFPHHENEIAQAQAAGKSFARFWIHNGLLTVNSEKMSKSLGNFVTMEDALKRCGGEPDVMKMFFLSAHYRSPIDYTPSNLHAAGRRFDAFDSFCMRVHSEGFLKQHPALGSQKVESDERSRWRGKFAQAMDDDLNTPQALSVLDQLVKYGNQCLQQYEKPPLERSQFPEWDRLPIVICEIYHVLLELGGVLGLFSDVLHDLSKEELALLQEREVARRMRDFKRADDIRRQFADKGFIIEDTVRGPIVRIKRG